MLTQFPQDRDHMNGPSDRSPRTQVCDFNFERMNPMVVLTNKRNTKRTKQLIFALALCAMGISGMSSTAKAQGEGSALAAPIEGTWLVQVHRVSQNVTFTALQSFTAGGVTLATGTLDRTPLPAISPLYGTWQRAGHNTYVTSLSFFIFDDAGDAIAMLQNYETFQLNANHELVGTGEAYLCDTNGNNCAQVESLTFTGKRMNAQHS